jgi:hypothetical protein
MYNTPRAEKFLPLPVAGAFLIVALMHFGSCAGQRPPQGGPADTTAPQILFSQPAAGATNVRTSAVHLEFSEYVDRRSLEQSVFVSPPAGQLQFSWSGTEVDILLPETLRAQTTYIFSVGTDVVDLRNKNHLAATFALPFSTGDHIDSGRIAGVVYDPKPAGVFIFAYLLAPGIGDTLNPTRAKPDFVTQTGAGGTFSLTNLPMGTFRLVAVRDELRNFLYDVQSDAFGMLPGDLTLGPGSSAVSGASFRMTREDTARPFLSSAKSLHRSLVLLKFSEPIDPASVAPGAVTITDTADRHQAPVLDATLDEATRAQMLVVTEPLDTTRGYEALIAGVRDDHGNPITGAAAAFSPVGVPDSGRQTLELVGIADSSTGVAPDDTLLFAFGRSVRRGPFERGCSIATAAGAPLAGKFVWSGSSAARFVPESAMAPGTMYRVRVDRDSVQAVAGAAGLRESVWVRSFRVLDDRKLSSISGAVADSGAATGPLIVTATFAEGRKPRERSVAAKPDGAFAFELLPEGRYTLSVFRDADTSGSYSFGLPYPFRTAERFAVYSDTLKLRARWPMEGVVLRMK